MFAFDRRWLWAAWAFVLITTLVRLAWIGSIELAPDEAYYWDWSRRLSLGYYDQGPLIAYLIRLTTTIFGTNEFGVRSGVVMGSAGTLLCSFVLARRLFSPLTGFLTVVILGLTPLMEVGSVIATYDPLQVFFWVLAVVWLERALFAEQRAEQNRAWTFAGVATGLGFLSKHTMLFLVPCLFVFFLASPPSRVWLRRPQPYLAFLFVPLLYTGVIWWNAHHHWWTFNHLLFLAQKNNGTPLKRLGDLAGSQALLIGPVGFLGALVAAGKSFSLEERTAGGQRCRFLACMGLPVLGLFCLFCLKAKIQANWPACAWPALTILWAGWLTVWAGRSRRAVVRALGLAAFSCALCTVMTVIAISPQLRQGIGIHLAPDKDVTNTIRGWRELAARVQKIRAEEGGTKRLFFAGNGYQLCAELAFYLPDHPETHDFFLHSRLDMYSAYVDTLKLHFGEDAILVDDSLANDRDLRKLFEDVQWDSPLEIWRRPDYAVPIRTLHIARCRRYRLFVGLDWADGG